MLHELATRLVERGHRVRVFTGMTDGSFGETKYEMIPIPVKPHKAFAIFEWNARRWVKYFNERDEDIFIIATQPFFYFPRYLKQPCVSLEFGIVDTTGFSWRKRANFAYMRFTQNYIYHRYAARILGISKFTCSLLPAFQRKKCIPIYLGHEHVLPPPGTDRAELRKEFRTKYGITDDEVLLLYVGRINPHDQPYKGTAELMASAGELRQNYPESRMMMAGIGSDYDVKLCEEAGIIPVIEAPQKWMAGLYLASDIYCSCSKWEGFNLPLLEAQSFGKPAVAYRIGAHPEVLNDKATGFLVDTHEEFISRLGELINSSDLRSEMGARAAEWASRFTWDSYADGVEKVLEDVLREAKR